MKKLLKIVLWSLAAIFGAILLLILSIWFSSGNTPEGGTKIATKGFVEIGGIKQGYFIRGEDAANPVILYLHGGPGSPELPFIKSIELERNFTICYWEQRGAGITFTPDTDPATMTVEQMVEDSRQMTDSLRKWYAVDKVYLMGHSWGSYLGIKTAEKYPELYHAYIGIGQISNQLESERLAYDYIIAQAKAAGDTRTVKAFEAYDKNSPDFPTNEYLLNARTKGMIKYRVGIMRNNFSMDKLIRAILYYGGYTFGEKMNYLRGGLFSIDHIFPYVIADNLIESSTKFELPIYIIQGKYDYQVSYKLAKDYFDSIAAPRKEFFTFDESAHSPNLEQPEQFAKTIRKIAGIE